MACSRARSAGSAFNLTLLVVNGWNNVVDNNDGKTVGLSLAARPHETLQLYANYMFGPEQTDENGHLRHVGDVTAVFSPTATLSLSVNFDLGFEPGFQPADDDDPMTPLPDPIDEMWMGAALSARVAPVDWLAVAVRGEWYSDRDGFTTGTGFEDLTIFEGTLTLEARYATNMLVRLEYRHDQANEDIFFSDGDTDAPSSASQDTVTLGTVIGF
ncbi:MAG: outer membrane beta-barrel protein [Deltaproteobacteria bacterium]|nr:outer membrane beta-barrel protein [Deltaproteobacteria bacterium]